MAYTFIILLVFLFLITSGHRKEKDSVQVLGSGSMVKGAQKNVGKVVAKMNTTNKSATSGPDLETMTVDQLQREVKRLQSEIVYMNKDIPNLEGMTADQLRLEVKRLQSDLEYLNKEVAAVKIQSRARGRWARREVKSSLSLDAEKLKEEGNSLFKKGLFEQARDAYTEALKSCKDSKGELAITIHNNLAACYQQLSDFRSVVVQTNFVLEQQPNNLKALMRRMLALEPLEKYEQALEDARRVIQQAPANKEANNLQQRLSRLVRDRQRASEQAANKFFTEAELKKKTPKVLKALCEARGVLPQNVLLVEKTQLINAVLQWQEKQTKEQTKWH